MAKSTRKAAVRKAQQGMKAGGGDPIGAVVFWSVPSDTTVRHSTLKALYKKHGVSELWFPGDITAQAAFFKAVNRVKRMRFGDQQRAVLIRTINVGEKTVLGVVDETKDRAAEDLKYQFKTKVVFDRKTDSVRIEGYKHPAAIEIKQRYDRLIDRYVTKDVQKALVGCCMGHDGVCLKKTGGLYLIPAAGIDQVSRLGRVLEDELAGEFSQLTVYGDPSTTNSLSRKTKRALEEELAELQAEINAFREKAPNEDGRSPRSDAMQNRLAAFRALKAKAEVYKDMLSLTVDSIEQGLIDAENVVKEILGIVAEKRQVKVAKRAEARKYVRKMKRVVKDDA